jgi:hypothetical protein
VVERIIGNDEVASPILAGGTIFGLTFILCDLTLALSILMLVINNIKD